MRDLLKALVMLLALGFGIGASCTRDPSNPTPAVVGGATSTAGASSVGGAPQGGASAGIGGSSAAVGGSSWLPIDTTVASCPEFVEPTCATSGTVLSKERKAELKRQLTGWRPSPDLAKVRRWQPTYTVLPVCSVFWAPNNLRPFSQRRGSCTANAVGGALSSRPFTARLTQDDVDEKIYPLATRLDRFPKEWPPTDTGSDGASAWQAAVQLGYTTLQSEPITSLEGLQASIQRASCFIGVDWYDSMFSPTRCGELTIGGPIAGGHEVHVIGVNVQLKKVWIRNSWDIDWGLSRAVGAGAESRVEVGGYAYLSFGTVQKLLKAGGQLDCIKMPPPPANDNAHRLAVGF